MSAAPNTAIRRVGVIGGGQMGAGIAEVCARAGLDTVVCEADATAARTARERVAVSSNAPSSAASWTVSRPRTP